jgi:hypothetical protein
MSPSIIAVTPAAGDHCTTAGLAASVAAFGSIEWRFIRSTGLGVLGAARRASVNLHRCCSACLHLNANLLQEQPFFCCVSPAARLLKQPVYRVKETAENVATDVARLLLFGTRPDQVAVSLWSALTAVI